MNLVNIFSNNHMSTKRNYIERMNDEKVKNRIIANKYLNYFLVKIFGGDIITVYAKKL